MGKIVTLCFKKLGKHWYLDTDHEDPLVLIMDTKVERYLNVLDRYNDAYVLITLIQQGIVIHSYGLVEIKDADITKYLEDEETFNMTVKVHNHEFPLNSEFVRLLEENYGIDIANDIYRILLD